MKSTALNVTQKMALYIMIRLIYKCQKNLRVCYSFFKIKYFDTLAQGRFNYIFYTSIDADQNVNDLLTSSNYVK